LTPGLKLSSLCSQTDIIIIIIQRLVNVIHRVTQYEPITSTTNSQWTLISQSISGWSLNYMIVQNVHPAAKKLKRMSDERQNWPILSADKIARQQSVMCHAKIA